MVSELAFAHLNLRWNPFGQPDAEAWSQLAVVDGPIWTPAGITQILGDAGHGKSTHLRAVAARHPEAIYEYIPEGQRHHKTVVHDGMFFVLDEAQRLGRLRLRRLLRKPLTLVLGSHADLRPFARRPIRTVRLGGLRPGRLREILARRIEWARRGPGPVPRISETTLAGLLERYGGNLRAIEDELYERFQRLEDMDV